MINTLFGLTFLHHNTKLSQILSNPREFSTLYKEWHRQCSATPISYYKSAKEKPAHFRVRVFGAAKQIRTADLVITNDVLYHLSYSSIFYAADLHLRHKWRP